MVWGTGVDGDASISGTWGSGNGGYVTTCTGTAGNSTLTYPGGWSLPSYGYWIGIVEQTYGTGAGQWEVVMITNTASTTLTLTQPLKYTYATGAEVYAIKQYDNLTINGAFNPSSYNGSTGGKIYCLARKSITISSATSLNGSNGSYLYSSSGEVAGGAGYGFCGGRAVETNGTQYYGYQGGGTGTGQTAGYGGAFNTRANNGNGGGGGLENGTGGGGNYTTGRQNSETTGGAAAGSDDLTNMVMGGGGGGGYRNEAWQDAIGSGGAGGGMATFMSKTITNSSTINANGGNGGYAPRPPAGGGNDYAAGGAGGSILFVCETASLGSGTVTANGGATYGNVPAVIIAYTSAGRIAVHSSGSVTGTTSPTYTAVTDLTLKEGGGGAFILNLL